MNIIQQNNKLIEHTKLIKFSSELREKELIGHIDDNISLSEYRLKVAENNKKYTKDENYSIEKSIIDYKTKIRDNGVIECNCEDMKERRNIFSNNDPRKLCKHLIHILNIDKLPKDFTYFREDIEYYQTKEKGFKIVEGEYLTIPDTNYKYFSKFELFDWNDFYTDSGLRYGILFEDGKYMKIAWNKKHKLPYDFKLVELFIINNYFDSICHLTNDEKALILNNIVCTEQLKITLTHKYNEYLVYNIYDVEYDHDACYKDDYFCELYWPNIIVSNKFVYANINDSKKFFIERDTNKIQINNENLKKSVLNEINNRHNIYDKIEQMQELDNKKEKFFLDFDPTVKLLNAFSISISTLQFNKTLKKLGMLNKDVNLNNNNWIITRSGLNFGINLIIESNSSNINIPSWYIQSIWDYYDSQLVSVLTEKDTMSRSKVLWNKNTFKELCSIVTEEIKKEEELLKNQSTSSNKSKTRNEWLILIECPYCYGKNIHKKDIRKRKDHMIQRYQCQDCVKIFQEIIK